MRTVTTTLMLLGLSAVSLGAQIRGPYDTRSQGIPPGHIPPPGQCRVWYDNVPPGRQPAPVSCSEAERVASRSRNARVIYGSRSTYGRGNGPYYGPRAVPRSPADIRRAPSGQYGYRTPSGYASVPFGNGYEDGFEEGRDDGRDRDRFDPERHGKYRSGDDGYSDRYGWTRDQYRDVYREGFLAGYEDGYSQNSQYSRPW